MSQDIFCGGGGRKDQFLTVRTSLGSEAYLCTRQHRIQSVDYGFLTLTLNGQVQDPAIVHISSRGWGGAKEIGSQNYEEKALFWVAHD